MTQEDACDNGPEKTGTFPECCKEAAEEMAGCAQTMEKLMAHCGPMVKQMMASFMAKTDADAPSATGTPSPECGAGGR